jgi:DNA (cytosine-5)-methyltransferase 1
VFVLARRVRPGGPEELRRGEPLATRTASSGWDPDRWDVRDLLDADVDLGVYGIRESERTWLEAWQAFVQELPDDTLPGFPIWVDAFRPRPTIPDGTPAWKADFLRKNSDLYLRHRRLLDRWQRTRWGTERLRVADFPTSRRKLEWQARKAQPAARDRDLEGLVAHLRPSGIRVKPPTYLPALVAITQTSVLGPSVTGTDWRRLTPQEAARLQGIPSEGFVRAGTSDRAAYKQLGNAVNAGVVRHLAGLLFDDGGAPWRAVAPLSA